jgi:uncharacterized membrane protein YfcA
LIETLPSLFASGAVLLLTGVLAGFAAGLLGVGGGIVIVPILFTAFDMLGIDSSVSMHMAIGTSLATIIPTSIASTVSHNRAGAVDWDLFKAWFLWIFFGCLIGTWVANAVFDGSALVTVFGCIALVIAIDLVVRDRGIRDTLTSQRSSSSWLYKSYKVFSVPASIGALSSMMGIGGGTLSVPFLNALKFPMHKAVGTSAGFGLVIALPATAGYVLGGWDVAQRPEGSLGYISIYGFILITMTSTLSARFGAQIAHRLSEKALKLSFAGFLFITAARMLLAG